MTNQSKSCHCEERSDVAISCRKKPAERDCFAALAMTEKRDCFAALAKARMAKCRRVAGVRTNRPMTEKRDCFAAFSMTDKRDCFAALAMTEIRVLAMTIIMFLFCSTTLGAAEFDRLVIPRVKYDGGGDWYVGPTSMPNLMKQAGERLKIPVQADNVAVSISDPELFRYPLLFLTGHGQVRFKDQDINTLLIYLDNGGFLWVNDSYGIDKYIRREIRRLYPDRELELLPADHAIFNMVYDFKDGLPKIHEHDGKPPAAWALFDKGRMKILYTYESDIGDGLEDAGVHRTDTPEIREKAMQMALNILVFVMMQ